MKLRVDVNTLLVVNLLFYMLTVLLAHGVGGEWQTEHENTPAGEGYAKTAIGAVGTVAVWPKRKPILLNGDGKVDADGCKSLSGDYKQIVVEESDDVFFDGVPVVVDPPGTYCVPNETSVVECNAVTARLVRGPHDNSWSCMPRWPEMFGGADGADIMVCGGTLMDNATKRVYHGRVPGSRVFPHVRDPYADKTSDNVTPRLVCPPPSDVHTSSSDYMSNAYVQLPTNRFKRTRNTCAKYIYKAASFIRPTAGREGRCDCLVGVHGSLYKRAAETSEGNYDEKGIVSMPNACSPCVYSGGLRDGEYTVNVPRPCVNASQRLVHGSDLPDTAPCGTRLFGSNAVGCVDVVYALSLGVSETARQLLQ